MTLTLTVYPYDGKTSHERAEMLFAATGAWKFNGYVKPVFLMSDFVDDDSKPLPCCDKFEFDIPQAFTAAHPAIRYLVDHAWRRKP